MCPLFCGYCRISTTKFDVGNVIVGCLHDLQEETENFNLVVLKLRFVNCIFLSAHPSTNSRQRQKSCSYIISVFLFQHVLRNTGLGHNWLNKLVEQYKTVFCSLVQSVHSGSLCFILPQLGWRLTLLGLKQTNSKMTTISQLLIVIALCSGT